jgi:myo-inositol-1-phosphate synthase
MGSLTQMGTIRLGKRTDNKSPLIKDFVPLADLKDVVFTAGTSLRTTFTSGSACRGARQGDAGQAEAVSGEIKPMPAVFDQYYVKRLHGTHVKKGKNKRDLAEQLIADIQAFKKTGGPRGDDLVRVDGDFPGADGRASVDQGL